MSARQPDPITRFSPSNLDAATRLRIGTLLGLLRHFRRRSWLQESIQRTVRGATVLLPVVALALVAARLALLERQHDRSLMMAGLLLVGVFVGWVLLHRTPWWEAARRVDLSGAGRDRASTAVEMAVVGRVDPWVTVQAAAANSWASQQDVARLLPRQVPAGVGALIVVALAVVLAVAVPLEFAPVGPQARSGLALRLPSPPPGFAAMAALPQAATVDRDLLAADIRVLLDVEEQLPESPTKIWLGKVRATIEKVERGALGQSDALAELARLEKERPDQQTEQEAAAADPAVGASDGAKVSSDERAQGVDKAVRDSIAGALAKSLEAAPAGKEREELEKAAAAKDLSAISKWIEKMATKDMSDKELEKWIKVAEKFAKNLGDRKIPKKFEELAKRVERLRRKRDEQGGLAAADRQRLRDTRRNLQQLRRDHGDVAAASHRLQRLERGARQAADEMRRSQQSRLSPPGAAKGDKGAQDPAKRSAAAKKIRQQMQRAANELRREGERQKQSHAQRIGQARVRDLRDALSRSQRSAGARRDFEKRARSQRSEAEAKAQQGKEGKAGDKAGNQAGRMQAAKEGGRKAGEQAARSKAAAEGQGQAGKKGGVRLGQGKMDGHSRMRMMEADAKGAGQDPGNGQKAGDETGGLNEGQRPALRAGRNEKLKGAHGDGPTVKQTFLDAAQRGFARRSWREVYARYSDVAQEMMDKEALPAGRRAMVQRYFELIRPQALKQAHGESGRKPKDK